MPDNYEFRTTPEEDLARENDILQFAEEIVNYILNELRENQGEWKETFDQFSDQEKAFLYAAIADGFNDSTEE